MISGFWPGSVEEQSLPFLKLEKLGEDGEKQFGRGDIRCVIEGVLSS